MEYAVHPYEIEDLQHIADIEKECFAHPWSYDSFCMEYADKKKHYYVARSAEGEVLGYGGFAHVEDEAHIMNIAVTEKARRKGVGSAVLKALIACARSLGIKAMTLEVDDSNAAAIAVYEKAGFVCAGLRPHYYGWDKPARIYWLRF